MLGDACDSVLLSDMDAYWRAANYLSLGQIYLLDNPLLREPLKPEHVKPRVTGDWGATPVENFIYVHLNRVIKEHDLNMIYLAGIGSATPALVANAYLEGTYSELNPDIAQDEAGLRRLFRQFSFPGSIPSHFPPATPGVHDGGGQLDQPLCRAYHAVCAKPRARGAFVGRCLGPCWWCVLRAAGPVRRCWTDSRLRGCCGHARCLLPRLTAILRSSQCSKRGCAATDPRSSLIETDGCIQTWPTFRPLVADAWPPIRVRSATPF